MSSDFKFENISTAEEPLLDVIFVHGLTGDAYKTWSSINENEFWPNWLSGEFQNISIYTLGYPASLFEGWAKKEMDIFERSGNILEHFAAKGIGERPIAFITHSLGGILTKILIRKSRESSDEAFRKVSEVVRLVVFLATPHKGSTLANIVKVFPSSSSHIKLLANETGFLEDLNQYYRSYANNQANLSTKVYYEKLATKKIVTVVSRESADPGITGTEPIALDKDHINICKPEDRDDIVYLGIRRHIKKLLDDLIGNNPLLKADLMGINYLEKSSNDRRELLEKLIDADREHEYGYANRAQNEFARSYLKTGLYTQPREDHELLLSEVETRFITLVYHPLICKGINDEKIQDSVQKNIIDPLSEKKIGNTKFSARSVLTALYYLTEQCHIRWDHTS